MNSIRVVVDTNILISGLFGIKDSPSSQILAGIQHKKLRLVTSLSILNEVQEVINRQRIVKLTKMSLRERELFMELLYEICEIVKVGHLAENISRDKKDIKFLEYTVPNN